MKLKPLTNGAISGTGTVEMEGVVFGGAQLHTDDINQGTIVVRKNNSTGDIVFTANCKINVTGSDCRAPIMAGVNVLYYSITGTGFTAQLFESIL